MYYSWLTVFLALVVFLGRLPATVRRVRVQREALHPVQPITRFDHLPCIVNTIGAVLTEFFMLGLLTLVVFLAASAAFGTLGQAPDLTTGIRDVSLGALMVMILFGSALSLLLTGGSAARFGLAFGSLAAIVSWLVISDVGKSGAAVLVFALLAAGAPALFIKLLRRLR